MLDDRADDLRATRPERSEPAYYALASVIRALQRTPQDDPHAWLFVFSDLLDKARQLGTTQSLQVIAAAAAAAPAGVRTRVEVEVSKFEAEVASREQFRNWTEQEKRRILLLVPKADELASAEVVFELGTDSEASLPSHMRYRRRELVLGKTGEVCELSVVCLDQAGTLSASNAMRDCAEFFGRPDLALLCGMAMGIPHGTKPEFGDVVVANVVFDTNPKRVAADGDHSRFEPYRVSPAIFFDTSAHVRRLTGFRTRLDLAARSLINSHERPSGLSDGWHSSVSVRNLVSGDELVEDGTGPERAAMHDRIEALEMEASGFAATCHHLGVPWLVVRGIADYGTVDRDKRWQVFASAAAMSFARTFLENEYTPGAQIPGARV